MAEQYGDIHTAHCCKWHGCKYDGMSLKREDCSVSDLGMKQEYPCEWCSEDWKDYIKSFEYEADWIEYIKTWKAEGGHI